MWSAYASLAEADNRQAFARTIRSVVEPGGQTVSTMDPVSGFVLADLDHLGGSGRHIPVSHARAAHEAIPGSRLVIIEGVGHFPQIKAPEQIVAWSSTSSIRQLPSSRRPGSPANAQTAIPPTRGLAIKGLERQHTRLDPWRPRGLPG